MKWLQTACVIMMLNSPAFAQLKYPATPKESQVDTYFGQKVSDPYRWLENDNSAQTKDWVTAQNKVTFGYLDKIPFRKPWFKQLEKLNNYPKYSSPSRKNEYYYYYKNDGLQNQAVLYRQRGLEGKQELVLDPNKFSKDGTTSLALFSLSKDGNYAVVGKSTGGSDWRTLHVMDMNSLTYLPDSIPWVKVSGANWLGDGFFYSRYPVSAGGAELSSKNENHQVYFHRVGTAAADDQLVFEDAENPLRFHGVFTSEDERYVFLNISDRSRKRGNAIWYYDNEKADKTFKPIVAEADEFSYSFIDDHDGKFIFETNDGARNSMIVLIDPEQAGRDNWKILVPERKENIAGVSAAGGKLFITYTKDVTSRVYVFDMNGQQQSEVELPALGTVGGFGGEKEDEFVFYSFTSFTFPPTIYKYEISTGNSEVFREPELQFKPENYITEQVFFTSKDGTKVPMFIVYKKGLKRDGKNPTIVYAYGGFNISVAPSFSPSRISWLDQGGIYASANIRGGSEYGEQWHEAGMLLNKQNVFDDFVAAAKYLQSNNYTSPAFTAMSGGSNGGLLVGTVANQHPELFKVALPAVGVMDMLRFHKFTIGFNWIAEYGSSEVDEPQFKNLYAYSPMHNVSTSKNYPATLVTTADHDDRVVPAHSFKYIATLQDKYKGANPVLIRVDVNSGHGASNLKKGLETTADIYSFIFYNMGLTPKF